MSELCQFSLPNVRNGKSGAREPIGCMCCKWRLGTGNFTANGGSEESKALAAVHKHGGDCSGEHRA